MEDDPTLPKKNPLRRFRLKRNEDETGISGVGYVAEGCQLSDGTCVMRWLSATTCTAIYHSHVELIHIHGHGGCTVIEWIDPEFAETEENEKAAKKKSNGRKKKTVDK